MMDFVIKLSGSPLFSESRFFYVKATYPDCQAGLIKPKICISDWHLGHLKTGLGRGVLAAITTCKTSCTRDSSFLALPCKNP